MPEAPVADVVARPGRGRRFVGVRRQRKTWLASISIDGKQTAIGYFASEEEAARARDARALELHGPLVRLNFPTLPPVPDGARAIQLTRGKWALVDEADYEFVSEWRWTATRGKHSCWYAGRSIHHSDGSIQYVRMHRVILGVGPGEEVDHKNGDGLDNRRSNLRVCTHLDNTRNVALSGNNTSGFKGVYWCNRSRKWQACIKVDRRQLWLGGFASAADAAKAYDAAAIKHFGEFARTNAMLAAHVAQVIELAERTGGALLGKKEPG